jgi:hypothetical protein
VCVVAWIVVGADAQVPDAAHELVGGHVAADLAGGGSGRRPLIAARLPAAIACAAGGWPVRPRATTTTRLPVISARR